MTTSPSGSARFTVAAARATRATAAANVGVADVRAVDPDPLGERDEVRREVGARSACPWPRRIAAIIRTVEDLPLVPTTWIERKRSCGEPRTVSSRRIRSSPNVMPNSSRSSSQRSASARVQADRCSAAGGLATATGTLERRELGASRSSFSRSASTSCGGALATKPSLASLPSARAISASSSRAPGREPALLLGRVDAAARAAARPCRPGRRRSPRRRRRPPRRPRGRAARGGRRAARSRRSRRPQARRQDGARRARRPRCASARTLRTASMTAPISRLGRRVERAPGRPAGTASRRAGPSASGHGVPDLLGHERDDRVRERERLAQHVQQRRRQVGVASSRPLTSSRYQSQSSP